LWERQIIGEPGKSRLGKEQEGTLLEEGTEKGSCVRGKGTIWQLGADLGAYLDKEHKERGGSTEEKGEYMRMLPFKRPWLRTMNNKTHAEAKEGKCCP